MRLKLYIFLTLMSITLPSFACDICGCGVGSYYIGILPEYNKRFIGLRYQHKSLFTHLGPQGQKTPLTATETYQTTELWGGWNFGQKWRALAFIPYNFNSRTTIDEKGSKNGIGDIALMAYYNVVNSSTSTGNKLLVQSLWLGAGIKLATGKYEPNERLASSESPNNFQLGSASTDFSFNAAYDIRLQDIGLNLNINYKLNTENKYDYRYGNKLSLNTLFYYKFRIAHTLTVAPNTGILFETADRDIENQKYEVASSGGYSQSFVTGAEIAVKNLSIGANYQFIQNQKLADGRALARNKLMVHLSIPF